MLDQDDVRDGQKLADRATLKLLSALEGGQHPTQRGLAQQIGVALGMTNSLLKRAVRKGLVKITSAPAKRYAYYVTPKGISEKGRLVAEYLSTSLSFFRQARQEYSELYDLILQAGYTRVVLCGAEELAEIAMLSAQHSGIQLCGVVELGSNQSHFHGVPVYTRTQDAEKEAQAFVITAVSDPQSVYDRLVQDVGPERIFVAPLLHVRRKGTEGAGKPVKVDGVL